MDFASRPKKLNGENQVNRIYLLCVCVCVCVYFLFSFILCFFLQMLAI
jgi:hypothetical protein